MNPGQNLKPISDTTEDADRVSGRFLSDFFRSLERGGVPATELLGDLPIPLDETGRVARSVDWLDFVEFMKRLEHHVGGRRELESCGEKICEVGQGPMFQSLVGLSASPYSLYRAGSQWALRRAMPGLSSTIKQVSANRIEIRVQLAKGLRPCPQLFHLAVGAARTLPRILGLADAVVSARIEDSAADYLITLPASRTLWARLTRIARTVMSARSIIGFLEAQQLELHAKHEELESAKEALATSERRHRTLTDAAVDVLCELDESGHILYVSASVEDLIGYTPEQVTGSHFSLWVPGAHRDLARAQFEIFATQQNAQTANRLRVQLQTESAGTIVAEISLRPYRTPEGDLRMVVILRDESDRPTQKPDSKGASNIRRDADSLRALRQNVDDLQASPKTHPVQRSLDLLLSALEANAGHETERSDDNDGEVALQRMVSATDRMTQIVERAMVNLEDDPNHFRWLETAKFCERIRTEFATTAAQAGQRLQVEATNAPPLFWAEDGLLGVSLGSLLDWASECAGPEIGIRLDISGSEASGQGVGAVTFSVGPEGSTQSDGATGLDSRLSLALATAKDATEAMGGAFQLERVSTARQIARIRLAQPIKPGR